jgi:GTP pyrophosphokinase
MVKTRESHAFLDAVPEDLGPWLGRIKDNNSRLDDDINEALLSAVNAVREAQLNALEVQQQGTLKLEGDESNCLQAGLEMAEILSELGVTAEGLQAGILYRAVRENKLSLASVRRQFGKGVAKLISSVLDMAIVTALRDRTSTQALGHDSGYQTSKVREMLVSIIDDVRVALLKLAERTYAIRAVKDASEDKRRAVANEIFDIYAPLAHRLGIGHLKWELEDLAFRYMEPDEYQQIARLLAEKRSERQQYIDEMIETIDSELTRLGKAGEVSGRAKNIYSIWRKMHRKDIGFSQVYDIRAVRVLVPTVSDCYAVLGIVHSKWRNIPNEFDDYIASPKDNGYRSLHTAVIGPGRKVIEIQIRTFDMHEEAEFGICAHWHYKDDGESDSKNYDDKMAWLRQVLEWHDSIGDQAVGDFLLEEKASERVYVYTPKGHVVDLPSGATPVDFAYQIHSEIGHRCKGAKINDRIVALNYQLKTADQVEILTGKHAEPNRDWLNSTLAYIKTTRARSKIQQWFKSQNRDQNIQAGQAILASEFHRLGMDASVTSALAERFAYSNVEDFYEQIGSGQLGVREVLHAAQQEIGIDPDNQGLLVQQAQQFALTEHYIYGVGDMRVRVAECCSPHPGQPIGGYKTRDRGVTVHRKDCGNLLHLESSEPLNILQLSWGRRPQRQFPVKVAIKSYDRGGLLRDITGLIDELGLFIQALNTLAPVEGMIQIEMTTEIDGFEQLSQLLARMRQIPNVVDVWRLVDQSVD